MVFQILAKIETMRNKNRLFGRHFEMVQHLKIFFSRIMVSNSAYIYCANFIAKFRWKSGFLAGVHGTHGYAFTAVVLTPGLQLETGHWGNLTLPWCPQCQSIFSIVASHALLHWPSFSLSYTLHKWRPLLKAPHLQTLIQLLKIDENMRIIVEVCLIVLKSMSGLLLPAFMFWAKSKTSVFATNLGDIFSCPEFPIVRLNTMNGFSEWTANVLS